MKEENFFLWQRIYRWKSWRILYPFQTLSFCTYIRKTNEHLKRFNISLLNESFCLGIFRTIWRKWKGSVKNTGLKVLVSIAIPKSCSYKIIKNIWGWLFVKITHTSDTTQFLSFSVWLISLRIMSSGIIHIVGGKVKN